MDVAILRNFHVVLHLSDEVDHQICIAKIPDHRACFGKFHSSVLFLLNVLSELCIQ
jgi:hypothetical protein